MYLLVTDRATCPRCGPRFGLILLADRVEERRVLEGHLGCPNCREHYPIRAGFGDLRSPELRGAGGGPPREDTDPQVPSMQAPSVEVEGALRVAALLGVERGPGFLLVMGPSAPLAGRVARMVEGIEVVAVGPGVRTLPEEAGVSRLEVGPPLPFFDATFQGVALEGAWVRSHLDEGLRTLRPGGRMVLLGPGEGDAARLEAAGLELLLVTSKAVVAGG